jgi:hypothetical protein
MGRECILIVQVLKRLGEIMHAPYFLSGYQILVSVAALVLGLKLLSRKAFVLVPAYIYIFLIAPPAALEIFLAFQSFGSYLFGIVVCIALVLITVSLVGLWLIRRYANGVLIFNCEQRDLIESITQALRHQQISFTQERATFSVNQGQSVIQIFSGSPYPSILNVRGNKSYFPALLEKLKFFLREKYALKVSRLAFVAIFLSIFGLGMAGDFAFRNAFNVDLQNYGELVRVIGDVGVTGLYAGGIMFAFVFLVTSLRLFIPRPFIITTRAFHWGLFAGMVWVFMIAIAPLINYNFSLLLFFCFIGMGVLFVFVAKAMPAMYVIYNLPAAVVIKNLIETFESQQLEFEEIGNEFHLKKSGMAFNVVPQFMPQGVSITVTGPVSQPNLRLIEKSLISSVKKQPGTASAREGFVFLAIGLAILAFWTLPMALPYLH